MVTVCFASKYPNDAFKEKMEQYFGDTAEVVNKVSNPEENGKYISEVYNEMLNEAKTDVVIFVHDNVEFLDSRLYRMPVAEAIEYQFEHNPEYSIIGVGPRSQNEPDVIVRDYLYYEAFYSKCEEDGSEQEEIYSGTIEKYSLDLYDADLVDGVFLAVKRSRLKAGFDNNNKTFDFYDLDICIGNLLAGSKVGITKAFHLLHYRSRGESVAWERYDKNKIPFLERWKDNLPIKVYHNKPQIAIFTPCSRIDNLLKMCDSIEREFSDRRNADVLWTICVDKYNSYGDWDKFARSFRKKRVNVVVYPTGKGGQKNYGGDMLNDAVKHVKNYYYGSHLDPWIYVMDDDNIACPLMADQINEIVSTADKKGKKIVWMSMSREDGFIDTIRSYSIFGKGAFNHQTISDEFMPDPSEILIKYSKLEELGFYDSGYGYDQKFWSYFYEHIDEILLPEEWHPGHWAGRPSNNFFQCYHNGNNISEIPYVENIIKENGTASFSLVVGTNERCDRFVLERKDGIDTFLRHAKPKNYKYSILTCIFGEYESLKEIKDYREDVEYICVTDNHNLKSEQWKLVYNDDFFLKLPAVDRFAYVRFHPFQFVESDICVTIDASVEILTDFYDDIIKPFIDGGYEYAATLHYKNKAIKNDLDTWQAIRGYKDGDYKLITEIIGKDLDKIEGCLDGGFIIHSDKRMCHTINEMTWELAHALSSDNSVDRNFQLELGYVLNKYYKDSDRIMLIHPFVFEGRHIRRWTHNGRYWIVYHSKDTCPCIFWNRKVDALITG